MSWRDSYYQQHISQLLAEEGMCPTRPCEPLLVDGSPASRQLFKHLINHFDLEGLYAVYSLRRGGATWDFLLHQWREPC